MTRLLELQIDENKLAELIAADKILAKYRRGIDRWRELEEQRRLQIEEQVKAAWLTMEPLRKELGALNYQRAMVLKRMRNLRARCKKMEMSKAYRRDKETELTTKISKRKLALRNILMRIELDKVDAQFRRKWKIV